MTPDEDAAIRTAAEALDLTISQLVEIAAVEATHRLGVFEDAEPAKLAKPAWVATTDHREESASCRLSISFSPPNLDLVQRVARRLDVPATAFAVGASLHYIAIKKR